MNWYSCLLILRHNTENVNFPKLNYNDNVLVINIPIVFLNLNKLIINVYKCIKLQIKISRDYSEKINEIETMACFYNKLLSMTISHIDKHCQLFSK